MLSVPEAGYIARPCFQKLKEIKCIVRKAGLRFLKETQIVCGHILTALVLNDPHQRHLLFKWGRKVVLCLITYTKPSLNGRELLLMTMYFTI